MIRRPKATETEEDLLVFQDKFLSAGEKPSVSVSKAQVGSKRVQQGESSRSEDRQERDVVNLQVEGTLSIHV